MTTSNRAPSTVRRAGSVNDVLKQAQFVTLHVPLLEATRHLVNDANIGLMRPGAALLNFSREGVVSDSAVLAALAADRLGQYVCDFPGAALHGHARVIALPHLGASTREAEDNCAVMVVDQVRDYLEHGNLANAVNFPNVSMGRESAFRVAIHRRAAGAGQGLGDAGDGPAGHRRRQAARNHPYRRPGKRHHRRAEIHNWSCSSTPSPAREADQNLPARRPTLVRGRNQLCNRLRQIGPRSANGLFC